jgi:transcription elongation factor Elf1
VSDPLTCPFCGSAEVELVSAWGGQLITSQVRCQACNTHFEALRTDFDTVDGSGEPSADADPSAVGSR